MKLWESGRESSMLDDIIARRKTIEGRLNRGKFAKYAVGDTVRFRRDYRDELGVLHDGELDAGHAEIIAVRQYKTFIEMVKAEGYKRVIPSAISAQAAAAVYETYYSSDDQDTHGVLAIEIVYKSL